MPPGPVRHLGRLAVLIAAAGLAAGLLAACGSDSGGGLGFEKPGQTQGGGVPLSNGAGASSSSAGGTDPEAVQAKVSASLRTLKVGDCFESTLDGLTLLTVRAGSCSDVKASRIVELIVKKGAAANPFCPSKAPGDTYYTGSSIYGSDNATPVATVCAIPNWLSGACYVSSAQTSIFQAASCAIARTPPKGRSGAEVTSVVPGSSDPAVCKLPAHGWPDQLRKQVACVNDY